MFGAAVVLSLVCSLTYSQAVFSPRALSLGAYPSFVNDVRGSVANPAALPSIRDWDVEVVSSFPRGGSGFEFDGVSVGKRLFDRQAFAVQYSPATELDFILPSSVRFSGIDFSTDRTISYKEPLALSYGVRLTGTLSAGIAGRMRMESVSEPQLQFVDTSVTTQPNEDTRTSWFLDAGLNWQPSEEVTVAALARGIPIVTGGHLSDEFRQYELSQLTTYEGGVNVALSPALHVGLAGSTVGTGALGVEWLPANSVSVRGALYADKDESPFVSAFGVGAGWTVGPLELEASFLRFANQTNRSGTIFASALEHATIHTIGMSPFAPDRLSLGVKVSLGNVRVQLIRITGVKVAGPIYPVTAQTFAYRPIGTVRVRNVGNTVVEARSSFFIDRLMDNPTESAEVAVEPGEDADIPLLAVFNDRVQQVQSASFRDAIVHVSVVPPDGDDEQTQTQVVVRGRNDWDGNAESLRYFMKPEDPEVIRTTRDILLRARASFDTIPPALELFQKARVLFNAFAGKLVYVSDPKMSADYVQYPAETLRLGGGDCDDFTVCFASLLASVGISTAFVDVVPPKHPDQSHIYLMFDTGIDPQYADQVSLNPKRYVIRRTRSGKETVWIPVETTVTTEGFEKAWSTGAHEYFDSVELNFGLTQGWVRVVDTE